MNILTLKNSPDEVKEVLIQRNCLVGKRIINRVLTDIIIEQYFLNSVKEFPEQHYEGCKI